MSKIRIKNFGPIKEGYQENDGWLDVKKVTVFIGNQGSGKSTVAKLISTLSWIEKVLHRGDLTIKQLTVQKFLNLLNYQRINNYYNNNKTEIEFEGDKYFIKLTYQNQFVVVRELEQNHYLLPQIIYIPAERNFLSSVSEAFNVKGMPETLFTFAQELRKAQKKLDGKPIDLPISKLQYSYDDQTDTSYIHGEDFKLNLLEASSGFQSTIPLFLVTRNLVLQFKDEKALIKNLSVDSILRMSKEISNYLGDEKLSKAEKDEKLKSIADKYITKCLINVVEEPEQNLFPSSQRQMLYSLLGFNNMNEGNKLIMTTHSPYLINYLTLCVKAYSVFNTLKNKNYKMSDPEMIHLNEIVPLASTINSDDLVIYELNEMEGTIKKLETYKGLPSDENYLNASLEDSNELFAQLQEIERGWR